MDASKKCVMILLMITVVYSNGVNGRELIREDSKETKLSVSINPKVNSVTSNGVGAQLDSYVSSGSYGFGSNGVRAASAPGGSTADANGVGVGDAYGYASATGTKTNTSSSSGASGSSHDTATAGPSGSTATSSSSGGGSSYNTASSSP